MALAYGRTSSGLRGCAVKQPDAFASFLPYCRQWLADGPQPRQIFPGLLQPAVHLGQLGLNIVHPLPGRRSPGLQLLEQ
ncbi:hypothetical protein DXZ75_19575 [Streptomyces sp. AcE210]|nr:hypothetical protein DXZ75_19575 [Streptomyces sp. AcE210]